MSDESGRAEVYIQSYPGPGSRRQVSTDGGAAPIWARAGGELFYRTPTQIVAVRVAVEPTFMVGRPRVLFQGAATAPTQSARNYDLLPSGDFVVLRSQDESASVHTLNVTLNWFSELRRRVPPPPAPATPSFAGARMGSSQFISGGMTAGGSLPGGATPAPQPPPAPPRPSFPSEARTIG